MKVDQPITEVVQIGAMSDPRVSDGRLIPFLTLDCSSNPMLEKAIEHHADAPAPGDVICTWAWQPLSRKRIYLKLDFKRPFQAIAYLAFDVRRHGYAVDWIRGVHGTYLQSSRHGDRVSDGIGKAAILIEVPHSATFPIWEPVYTKALRKEMLARGVQKRDLAKAIDDYRRLRKEFWFRFSRGT